MPLPGSYKQGDPVENPISAQPRATVTARCRREAACVGIYSPGRTVVDLMRMRHKLGESIAHFAVRRYLSRRDARVAIS
jgi:hypothetical protein